MRLCIKISFQVLSYDNSCNLVCLEACGAQIAIACWHCHCGFGSINIYEIKGSFRIVTFDQFSFGLLTFLISSVFTREKKYQILQFLNSKLRWIYMFYRSEIPKNTSLQNASLRICLSVCDTVSVCALSEELANGI